MTYSVKEIFYSLQGEGAQSGRPAVFCRFAGCNLWSGIEQDRETAVCWFCDTDFVGTDGLHGGKFVSAKALAEAVAGLWPSAQEGGPYVICTGGEPLLQLDAALVDAFHRNGFEVGIETNGTQAIPDGVDWVCVSPKTVSGVVAGSGNELKLVYPQNDVKPESFEQMDFEFFFLQPMDGPDIKRNTELSIRYCLGHPKWRLSLQLHKYLGLK